MLPSPDELRGKEVKTLMELTIEQKIKLLEYAECKIVHPASDYYYFIPSEKLFQNEHLKQRLHPDGIPIVLWDFEDLNFIKILEDKMIKEIKIYTIESKFLNGIWHKVYVFPKIVKDNSTDVYSVGFIRGKGSTELEATVNAIIGYRIKNNGRNDGKYVNSKKY